MKKTKLFLFSLFSFPLVLAGCGGLNPPSEYFSDGSVTGVSLDKSSISISIGAYYRLSATIAPKDAINTNIIWSVADETIATVKNGKVTGAAVGKTTVSVITEEGGFTASCVVNVVESGGTDDQSSSSSDSEDGYDPTGREDVLFVTEDVLNNKGEYDVPTGDLNKQIYVNCPGQKVTLNFKGTTLTYGENSPIYVANCDGIDISAKKSTTNIINDTRSIYTEDVAGQGKGAIYVFDGDLQFKGQGSLTINAGYYNGVHCKDDVDAKNLTLTVNAPHHGIKGNDSITIESGTINIICGGDGLKTENSDISDKLKQRGNVTLNGGTITINSWADSIDAAYDAIFEETDATIAPLTFVSKTNKYSSYDGETVTPDSTKLYLKMNSSTYGSGSYTYACYINNAWYKASYVGTQGGGGPGGGSRTNYIYSVDRPSNASSFVLYRFSGSNVTSFSTTSYNAKSDAKAFNDNYDMVTVSASGSTLSLSSWSNYSQSSGGGWGPGGQEGNTDKAGDSAKGVKAANEIHIISGSLAITAYDDGLHANADETLENGYAPLGNITVKGGTITVSCSDDGFHADNILDIQGGEISVTESYEGLEGNVIKVSGGHAVVFAKDDGVNASSGTATPQIIISGGYLDVTVSSSGDTDGIDSNGSYTQSGGTVVVRGPGSASGSQGGGAFALDAESSITIKGGTLVVFGGIERSPSVSNVTRTLCSSSTVSTGNHTVSFADGGEALECYLKYQTSGCVVYSDRGSATLN